MSRRFVMMTALALVMLAARPSAQSASNDRILALIDLGAGTPVGINANNHVALVNGYRSYLWTEANGLTDLGGFAPDYPQTRAFDLNDRGRVVGSVLNRYGFYHPFIWTLMDGLVDADPTPDAEWAAWAVNNAGEIVGGYGIWPSVAGSPWRRTADGAISTVRPFGANGGAAYDINDLGVAVGEAAFDQEVPYSRPFTWSGDTVRDLGTLGGADGVALRINSLTQVIGSSTTAAGEWHAFLWSEDTGMQDLGTLGGAWSFARAINEMGHVVGTAADPLGRPRAFFWSRSRGMLDLGPGEALAVNEFDQVVGTAVEAGVSQAFLWTPSEGRLELSTDARAMAVNNNGYIVGAVSISAGTRTVVWQIAITEKDWMAYRHGLIDAHAAYGTLRASHAHALRAMLTRAERAAERRDATGAQHALEQWGRALARWVEGELPWQ